jgi:hypothetical protein
MKTKDPSRDLNSGKYIDVSPSLGWGGSNVEARLRDDTKNHDPWIQLKPLREDYEPLIF